jgi:hypothetical protein
MAARMCPVHPSEIQNGIFEIFEKVDYAIRAGYLVDLSVIEKLEQLVLVLAVYGARDNGCDGNRFIYNQ